MYAVVYKATNKRVKRNDRFVPVFEHPIQAFKYIEKYMGDSKYITVRSVR